MNEISVEQLRSILHSRFHFHAFRNNQEKICWAVANGRDALVVMPTGAGKSLCYQAPGLARGGTTLVISPLVALIEDQCAKLQALGIRAARIHSGCAREDSRRVCQAHIRGEIDFLFIAPERLGVPGFPEFLQRYPPRLIAIDEAHCISEWGHDFRPDYRWVGERLKALRPVPILAMTATATTIVQNDICQQLELKNEIRFIEGFRRDNIGIHIVELPPRDRFEAIAQLLSRKNSPISTEISTNLSTANVVQELESVLPAIVYTSTRKNAESLTSELKKKFKVDFYHAGLTAEERARVQAQYLSSEFDVIVATVAFGMGIDKPNVRTVIHAALPSSLEGYYQEIGRAGRDGLPSQAILFHSYSDQKTHEYFFEINYPDEAQLKLVFDLLTDEFQPVEEIVKKSRLVADWEPETLQRVIEQLQVHHGAEVNFENNVKRGSNLQWMKGYQTQRKEKLKQMKKMSDFVSLRTAQKLMAFTKASRCRMNLLVQHFGDHKDAHKVCGLCDMCAPELSKKILPQKALTDKDIALAKLILISLAGENKQAAGRLFTDVSDSSSQPIQRGVFEKILEILAEKDWISINETSFTNKDGEEITYRQICLQAAGRSIKAKDLLALKAGGGHEAKMITRKAPVKKSTEKAGPKGKSYRRTMRSKSAEL